MNRLMPSENKKTKPNAPSKRSTFGFAWYGAPSEARTQAPLIKSQLLYRQFALFSPYPQTFWSIFYDPNSSQNSCEKHQL